MDSSFFNSFRCNHKKKIKTTSRNSVVLPFLIGYTIQIHNGKFFIPLIIREEMLGCKFGEFVSTRLRHIYKKKKNGSKIKSK
jgi:ribosomal protein S19